MSVTETFFSLEVNDMRRAIAFYVDAVGAAVSFESPIWSSLHVAGVRIGLFRSPDHRPGPVGLHFAVSDLDAARRAIERAGGSVVEGSIDAAPGVIIARVTDTEGNTFTLRGA